jgi:hypothetical protein
MERDRAHRALRTKSGALLIVVVSAGTCFRSHKRRLLEIVVDGTGCDVAS